MATNELHENNNHFWMVFIEGKGGSTKKHFTFDDARIEAERLLRLPGNDEGRKAYILGTCCVGGRESPPIVWMHLPV